MYAGPLGGGGGGGGSGFAELNLAGPPSTPAAEPQPAPTPTQALSAGQRLDGAQGRVMVFVNQYTNGTTEVERLVNLDPSPGWPDGLMVRLEGSNLESVDAYHNLPVSVWGEVSHTWGQLPTLVVERLEPVYPDLKVEAWLGLLENATLSDQQVQLFTTQDGEQFVLDSSITNPGMEELPGAESDPVVVEGILIPGQALGGYPVITDFVVQPMPGLNDLDEYQPFSTKPLVMQKPGTAGQPRQGGHRQDRAGIYHGGPALRRANRQRRPGLYPACLAFLREV